MDAFRHVLVVVDPADEQHKAINRALHMARLSDARLTLFLSIYDFSYEMTTMLSSDERDTMRANLIADRKAWLTDLLADYDTVDVRIDLEVVWHNRPFEAIIETAIKHQHDLIIKGTQVTSSIQNLLFTPTDWHLLRKAPCAVLLVKEHAWPEHGQIIAAVHSGSDEAHHDKLNVRIIEHAETMSKVLKASVHLVNAYPGAPVNVAVEIPEFDVTQYTEELEKHHQHKMQELGRRFDIPENQQHVAQGLPEQVIPDFSEKLDAELVVIGTIGRTGLTAALLGNTAEHVLERLNCDVLALKPEGFVSPLA
ncbi:universal stress protein UspE [Idiomarina seosinensis]|uniref:Universal stress protein UspE n=1 Tax=Idiomarina seosinensis TaxID=281739 RepID=A0A432ZHT2_9GAMM|nr:universal stress protein UspE [Idiomarina seosinensis]RUO77585.1 universal stress protein UspE [Idiomarina seosinensis]